MTEIKGLKIGEYFVILTESMLESILKNGLLPRAEVNKRIQSGEMLQLDLTDARDSWAEREYIETANTIIDLYRPDNVAHPRTDSVFAFVYRGRIDTVEKPDESTRSTILIHGLSGKELVGNGDYVTRAIWYVMVAKKGWPYRVETPNPHIIWQKIPQEEVQKEIDKCALKYWSELLTLDDFVENYRTKGLTWGMVIIEIGKELQTTKHCPEL